MAQQKNNYKSGPNKRKKNYNNNIDILYGLIKGYHKS
jgi:hypothetical protein